MRLRIVGRLTTPTGGAPFEKGDNLLTNGKGEKKFISPFYRTPYSFRSYINKQFKHLKVSASRNNGQWAWLITLFEMLERLGRGRENFLQLKSKLSRSKSLKLAIGTIFLPTFVSLIQCRSPEIDPFSSAFGFSQSWHTCSRLARMMDDGGRLVRALVINT